MPSYLVSPALYGSKSAAVEGISSARVVIDPARFREGLITLPSFACRSDGQPRFELRIPVAALKDVSTQLLIAYEQDYYGFEAPCRHFLETHIEPGDVFVDAGAHWGVYSLDVASLEWPDIDVLACEPVRGNAAMLRHMLMHNRVDGRVEVIQAALADFKGEASMTSGNAMTRRIITDKQGASSPHRVPVTTIDALLQDRPRLRGRRFFLKIDVEGAEWAVLQGTRETLTRENVAAIVLEYHPGRGDAFQLRQAIGCLQQHGYGLMRFPHHHMGGALLNFAPDDTVCNIVAVRPSLSIASSYTRAYRGFPPLPPPFYYEMDGGQRERRDAILREWHASDGARWSDIRNSADGDRRRAALAAAQVSVGERVLDLGCGTQALKQALPPACSYQGLDLIQRDDATIVADLNRLSPPNMRADHAVASHTLEHLHDPATALKWCAEFAGKLTCIHARGGHDKAETTTRLAGILNAGGWRVVRQEWHDNDCLSHCVAA